MNPIFHNKGYKAPSIAKALCAEGIRVSRVGVHNLLMKLQDAVTVTRRPGSGRLAKVTETIVEDQMRLDDETTASQLQKLLIMGTTFPCEPFCTVRPR